MASPKCRGDLGSCHRAGAWEAVGPKAGVCGARELLRGCQQGTGPWTWGTRATVHGPQPLGAGGTSQMTAGPRHSEGGGRSGRKALKAAWPPALPVVRFPPLSPSSLSPRPSTVAPSASQFGQGLGFVFGVQSKGGEVTRHQLWRIPPYATSQERDLLWGSGCLRNPSGA